MKKTFISFILIIALFLQFACSKVPQPVNAENGMVVSTSSYASKVGVEILKKGGNAIDAAVAVGFALAVTYPSAGNIGGGGFMVFHFADGENTSIDYREKAPLAAHKDMNLNEVGDFVPELSQRGTTSTGVPGSVAGLIYALENYGTLSLAEVIQPAIDLAKNGWRLERRDSIYFSNSFPLFEKYPSSKKIFTKNGELYRVGDADFYPVPGNKLISKEYARTIFERIEAANYRAVPSSEIISLDVEQIYESTETTHYSVHDSFGNSVSTTTTINSSFGSGIVVEGAGFLLNNEMDDFSGKPGVMNQFGLLGTEANSIQPEKRMLSSMTPTIILKDGEPYIVIGSPGGSKIITTVLQVVLNCIDFDMNICEAVEASRIHHQWLPDSLYYESGALTEDVKTELTQMGYALVNDGAYLRILGIAEGIMIDNQNKIIYGASDPRGGGIALGY